MIWGEMYYKVPKKSMVGRWKYKSSSSQPINEKTVAAELELLLKKYYLPPLPLFMHKRTAGIKMQLMKRRDQCNNYPSIFFGKQYSY